LAAIGIIAFSLGDGQRTADDDVRWFFSPELSARLSNNGLALR
jgi:hypothetical protein